MALRHWVRRFCSFLVAAAILVPATAVLAADSSSTSDSSTSSSSSSSSTSAIDLFKAIDNGDLDVKIIPHDSTKAQVIVKNNTDQPLTVKLPDAFVATPVLAQQPANNNGFGGNNNRSTSSSSNNNNKNQSVGGGMGGGGYGGGMFDIPPERVVKMQVPVVCLEYGKSEPNAHVPYKMEPADKYTSDGEVQAVCKLLGEGKLDQRAAQAAAWHVANHMSWDDLANMKTFPHFPQYSRPYFSQSELHEAVVIVDQAIKLADAKKTDGSKSASLAPTPSDFSTDAISSGTKSAKN